MGRLTFELCSWWSSLSAFLGAPWSFASAVLWADVSFRASSQAEPRSDDGSGLRSGCGFLLILSSMSLINVVASGLPKSGIPLEFSVFPMRAHLHSTFSRDCRQTAELSLNCVANLELTLRPEMLGPQT